jgi:hypothetical protein
MLVGCSVCTLPAAEQAAFAQAKGAPRVADRDGDRAAKLPLAPAMNVARNCQVALEKVRDYEASFQKRELIGGKLLVQDMQIKCREQPFSVYLKYRGDYEGREVIYVAGANNGNFLVHEAGIKSLAGTLTFAPDSPRVMQENHYPVSMVGVSNMLRQLMKQWEAELNIADVEVKYFPTAKLGDRDMQVVQSTHPRPKTGVKFHMTRLYVDKQTNLPVRVEQFGFPQKAGEQPPLIEEYTYSNIRVNVGLKDVDFDPKNPQYAF